MDQWKSGEVLKRLTSPCVAAKDLRHLDAERLRSEERIERREPLSGPRPPVSS